MEKAFRTLLSFMHDKLIVILGSSKNDIDVVNTILDLE